MKIGSIDIANPLVLAPMEDVTDAPFRLICKQLGADIVYTEFTASEAVIRGIPKALDKIRICDEERPAAIQLFGGREESMEEAARIAETFRPDFIDVNCGCWVKNVVARNEGAGLLRDLPKFRAVVQAVIRGTALPVTVKTRLGWDHNSICILEAARMLEDIGVRALSVHCRVRSQGHTGTADWEWLTRIKKAVSIPVIGNGDIMEVADVKRMLETGCDGVMIGRAAIGNPWIFQRAREYLKTGNIPPLPAVEERFRVALDHLRLVLGRNDTVYAVRSFRKFYAGYIKGVPLAAQLRKKLMAAESYESVKRCFEDYLNDTPASRDGGNAAGTDTPALILS